MQQKLSDLTGLSVLISADSESRQCRDYVICHGPSHVPHVMASTYKKPPFFALYSDEAFAAEVEVNDLLSM